MIKHILAGFVILVAASSTVFAQFNWVNWSYPTSNTATASVGPGTVNLTVSGTNNASAATADFPILYQPGFPYTQLNGDSVGAENLAYDGGFQMELDFSGFATTAGLTLAIGNLAYYPGFLTDYQMSALDTTNNPISLTTFGQYGNFDYTWPANGGFLFNDDLSMNPANGVFNVVTVPGQDDANSDMLIFSLPANVSKIFVALQNPTYTQPDTINFMLAPVPEASSISLVLLGGVAMLIYWRRKLLQRALPSAGARSSTP